MAKEKLECSFCGRKKPDTQLLIAGIDAHICDKCIEQAHGIVLEEIKSVMAQKTLDLFKETKEIRAFLDQYVIGQTKLKVCAATITTNDRCNSNKMMR
jgi:ATP-dependent Clp protease ATP-binding subunit ClpX